MCDYSLLSFPNRLAREGEELVVHRFPGGAKGLAPLSDLRREAIPFPAGRKSLSALLRKLRALSRTDTRAAHSKPVMAVCIPPGAQLLLRDIPEALQSAYHVRRTEEVTFTQIGAAAFNFRDAIHFRNGCEVILQHLMDGQRVRVLNLSGADAAVPEVPEFELLAPAS